MIAKIHQHPEWELVEKWFKERVGKLYPASDELALYNHIERIAIDVIIDEAVEQAARELGYSAGKNAAEISKSIAENF